MPEPTKPLDPARAVGIVKSIVASPPKPLNGKALREWHGEWHGGEDGGVYRATPGTFDATWQDPFSNKYEKRRFPAALPDAIEDCVEEACRVFEGYAQEPNEGELHVKISAQTLAWLVARLFRTWPFDSYNEEIVQLALQAATVRLGFSLSSFPLHRLDVRQDVAYAIVPRSVQPPSTERLEARILEHLKPLKGDSPNAGDVAEKLTSTHRAFSPEAAASDVEELNALDQPLEGPSSFFLAGERSRAGRRAHLRNRRSK